jgi:hypothetical protein
MAVAAFALPAAARAKTLMLQDGSQVLVAGTHLNCAVEWAAGVGHFTCFKLLDPLGNPPRGSYGFDLNSRYVAATRFPGGTVRPRFVAHYLQPAAVPRDVAGRKGRSRQTVTMRVGDVAVVAGSLVLALVRRGQAGTGIVVGPIDSRGKAIPGAYVVGLSDRSNFIRRVTSANGDAKTVFQRG